MSIVSASPALLMTNNILLDPQLYAREFPSALVFMIHRLAMAGSEGDGMICFGVPEMEPQSVDMLEKSLGKPLYDIGAVAEYF